MESNSKKRKPIVKVEYGTSITALRLLDKNMTVLCSSPRVGKFPTFKEDCMWGEHVKSIYEELEKKLNNLDNIEITIKNPLVP